jgi:hypothetical protein
MNKELDIVRIIKKLRQFDTFMKTNLQSYQIKFLKLKDSKFIDSTDQEFFDPTKFKMKVDENKVLDLYSNILLSKELSHQDKQILAAKGL